MSDENEATAAETDPSEAVPQDSEEAPRSTERARRLAEEIERHWADHIPGSIVSRSTEVLNYLSAWKEKLKERLRDL